jgi:hypothetical protein
MVSRRASPISLREPDWGRQRGAGYEHARLPHYIGKGAASRTICRQLN